MTEVGVDIGGTFTDLAVYDGESGSMRFGKVLSTPHDPSQGVADIFDAYDIQGAELGVFVHGSTVAINALIERTGACTALITTAGFRDVLEIGRGNRPNAYELTFQRLQPLIPRALRFEITERMRADGETLIAPELDELHGIVDSLRRAEVEAVAICLIHSYRNPSHEQLVAERLRELWPEGVVSASHELSGEFREYERTSTVAVNAYVAPKVRRYLDGIQSILDARGADAPFYVVESNAGVTLASRVYQRPCFLMESGPVAGVVGSARVGELLGHRNVVAFDMGGTTAKACLVVDGTPPTADEYFVGGYARGYVLQIPVLDLVEVGTGGGSIAWLDDVGGVHVGPRSASSVPGPACYPGGGSEPTVTDANLILGRLNPDHFAGGRLQLAPVAAEKAMTTLAQGVGMETLAMAAGVVDLANITMAEAVRLVTIRRGLDPRDFVMVAFGGGGPLHAAAIARDLSIPTVVIPPVPGNFSAIGMLMMDLRRDSTEVLSGPLDADTLTRAAARLGELREDAAQAIFSEEGAVEGIASQQALDVRYVGQQHTIRVGLPDRTEWGSAELAEVRAAFDDEYERRFGHAARSQPAEVVAIRLTVQGIRPRLTVDQITVAGDAEAVQIRTQDAFFPSEGRVVDCPVFDRATLGPGFRIEGPALVEEDSSTTVIEPGDVLEVNDFGHLVIHVGASA